MTKTPAIPPLKLASIRPDKLRAANRRRAAVTTAGTPIGNPPAYLGAVAAEIWRDVVAAAPAGLLQASDAPLMETYCTAAAIVREAAGILAREGLTTVGRNSDTVRHPAGTIFSTASAAMLAAANALGLSPRGRARLGISTDPTPPASDPYDI